MSGQQPQENIQVDAATFFNLRRDDAEATRWVSAISPGISSGNRTLYGGSALAIALEALERTCGRAAIWATAQFYGFARPGDRLVVDADLVVTGDHHTQARARGWIDDREIFIVAAALGRRALPIDRAWPEPPALPPWERWQQRDLPDWAAGSIFEQLEVYLCPALVDTQWAHLVRDDVLLDIPDTPDARRARRTGRSFVWVRVRDLDPCSAALGLIGDLLSWGPRTAVGAPLAGQSLDNSLRIAAIAPTEWYLVEIQTQRIAHGVAYSIGHIWSEDGVLLGTASQSQVARPLDGELPPAARRARTAGTG